MTSAEGSFVGHAPQPTARSRPVVAVVGGTDPSTLAPMLDDQGFEVIRRGWDTAEPDGTTFRPDVVLIEVDGALAADPRLLDDLRRGRYGPVIVITRDRSVKSGVAALEAGADDYLIHPFSVEELAARVRAVLRRRVDESQGGTLRFGNLELDLERRICRRNGLLVHLARAEWHVLVHLARHRGRVIIATELLRQCWGPGYESDLQVLRICISRLRRKLGAPGRDGPIRTYHYVGYALDV